MASQVAGRVPAPHTECPDWLQELEEQMARTVNILRIAECSAKDESAESAISVLEFACDASLHPIMPLYNHVAKRLRCRAIRALNRIFDICNEDSNGALSMQELRKFHLFAYGELVTDDDLRTTRQVPPALVNASLTAAMIVSG
jgi:hypothetical protein